MSRYTAAKKIYAVSRKISRLRGGLTIKYYLDGVHCSKVHGASPENYFVLRFFDLSEAERRKYLTSGRSKEMDKLLNFSATDEDKRTAAEKHLFNRACGDYVKRAFVFAPESDFQEFSDFIASHKQLIAKPDRGTQGKGVRKVACGEISDIKEFYNECAANKILLEERIVQHPCLDKINSFSVNSIRINTARKAGETVLIGGCIKCGTGEKISDNFHAGGIAYPVDLATGIISGPGRNNVDLTDYEFHPGSNVYMPGYEIPFWTEIIKAVKCGMDILPSLGYIGWDIAVTPDGPEIIEANYSWPGGNIIQFDGVGKYPLLLNCCGERDEQFFG